MSISIVDEFSNREDYHQLPSYARVMERIGWDILELDSSFLFVKRLGPVAFAKFQRPRFIDPAKLLKLQGDLNIVQLFLEPALRMKTEHPPEQYGFRASINHHAYTKTAIFSISGSEPEVLGSFSSAMRSHMRRSQKNDVQYERIPFAELKPQQRKEILVLHKQWSDEKKVMGYPDSFLRALWEEMTQEGTMIMARRRGILEGVLFVLCHHRVGMYFYQFSSALARDQLYIPSGLSYHATLLARQRGCDIFDLCSVYDERYAGENIKWKGFTEHKKRFHPAYIEYPSAFQRLQIPFL